jgi:hypothetical protein
MKTFAHSELESVSLSQVKNKRSIDLCSRFITSISDDAKDIKAQSIVLCCNQLSSLPSFGLNLKILNLSRNQLKFVPESLFNCVQLIELDLSFNQIRRISGSLGKLINLKKLILANNALAEIPQEIGNCSQLEVLNVANNCIYTIAAEFSLLKNVKSIYLDGNPLYPVVNSESASVPSLRELAARQIKDLNISIDELPGHFQDYISSGKKCSYCSKSFYESCVRRGRFIVRGTEQFPIEYKLCSSHWTTEQERVRCIFRPKIVSNSSLAKSASSALNSIKSMEVVSSTCKDNSGVKIKRTFSFSFWNKC